MKHFFLLLLITALSSCNLFYKTVFGIKNPKIETYYSINKYAKSIDVDSSLVAFTKDSTSYFLLNHIFMGSPEIVIFNKRSEFVPYKSDSIACNASVDTVLRKVCDVENTNLSKHKPIDYNNLINLLDDHNKVLAHLKDKPYDYLIFIDFAKYFHKVNKNHIPGWNNSIRKHYDNCNIAIVYVDLDYLNTWKISKESLPTFKLSGNK
ncbi:MAG: hypothetical protein JWP12_1946 [Bacteroidetes bacterium]|nr:hypothetical protein [Bacteroidota bacterium]